MQNRNIHDCLLLMWFSFVVKKDVLKKSYLCVACRGWSYFTKVYIPYANVTKVIISATLVEVSSNHFQCSISKSQIKQSATQNPVTIKNLS